MILDTGALADLVHRQRAAADTLDELAERLLRRRSETTDRWTTLPEHADAAAALDERLAALGDRVAAAAARVAGLADAVTSHAAAVAEADRT